MKRLHVLSILAVLTLVLCCILPTKAEAATEGYYTYKVSDGEAEIISCDTSISGNITIPSTLGGYPVTSIGDSAFYYCSSLTRITIPDSVTSIGAYAFWDCSSLTRITIPNSVTSIDGYAFYCCSSLTSITIPSNVTSIGEEAFSGCSSLTGIFVEPENAYYSSSIQGVLFNKQKTQLIQAPGGLSGVYTIPDSVTSIGAYAFCSCSNLTSITIPDSVTSIDSHAFAGCSRLTSITIPDSVISVGGYAFRYCSSLTNVSIGDSVTSIGDDAFYECSSLTSVSIGNSVTSIGNYAFSGCKSLTIITIPDSVTSIGEYAFGGCSSLTSVTIGNSLTRIGDSAFYECSSLTCVTIGNNVTSIGYEAFRGCSRLTSITIPDSVTSIGYCAFYECGSLDHVAYAGTQEQWSEIAIASENTKLTKAPNFHYETTFDVVNTCVEYSVHCPVCEIVIMQMSSSSGSHSFAEATCTTPMTCTACGVTEGETLRHSYSRVVTPPTATEQGYTTYTCGACGHSYVTDYTNPVSTFITITKQPEHIVANNKETVTLTIAAEGNGLKYQWYRQEPGTTTWTAFTSAASKTANFAFTAYDYNNGRAYQCIITDAAGNQLASEIVTLTVRMITKQPTSQYAKPGETAKFTVNYSIREGVKYQWQFRYATDPETTWRTSSQSGSKTDTLTFKATGTNNGYSLRCVITDGDQQFVTDGKAHLWVQADAATVTSAPSGILDAVEGYYVFLNVTAKGNGMKYYWQASTDGGKTFYNCTSSTSANTANFRVIAYNYRQGYMYRCAITTPNASDQNVTYTDWVTLNILPGVEIIEQPQDVEVKAGKLATFMVTAQMPDCVIMEGEQQKGDGSEITYKWQRSKTGTSWTYVSSYDLDTLTITATEDLDGYYYRCIIFNDSDQGGGYVVSDPAQLKLAK